MTPQSPPNLIRQKVSLLQEAEISLYTIESGLASLEKNQPYAAKPFYFVWYLTLSTGFERMMKVIVCLHEYNTNQAFPTRKYLRDIGHNLVTLKNELITRCFTTTYLSHPFAQDDLNFVKTDELFNSLISALSDFANNDRYIFMNGISQPEIGNEWPKGRWEELEKIALTERVYVELRAYPETRDTMG